MISNKHKFIFIHIPKTGGTSISRFFGKAKWQQPQRSPHQYDLSFYRGKKPIKYKDYFKFTFVRNPWDKMVSEYFWFTNTQYRFPHARIKKRFSGKTFPQFVRVFLRTKNPGDFRHRLPQTAFLKPLSHLDFIGRFENLQEDFGIVCDKLGISRGELPHANRTCHKPYWEYYNDELLELVAAEYEKDINTFGYKFGE